MSETSSDEETLLAEANYFLRKGSNVKKRKYAIESSDNEYENDPDYQPSLGVSMI